MTEVLNDYSYWYVMQNELTLRLIAFGFIILGAIAAGVFSKSTLVISRAPFFAFSGLITFLASAVQLVWLASATVILANALWLFILIDIGSALVCGWFFYVIAMGRSRSAYGTARYAFLALIPIAGLWLLFTPTKQGVSNTLSSPFWSGFAGVVLGLLFSAGSSTITLIIEGQTEVMMEEFASDPDLQRVSVDWMIRADGLAKTLEAMAQEVRPRRLDHQTELLGAETTDTQLIYRYEVAADVPAMTNDFRQGVIDEICNTPVMEVVMESGASIEFWYAYPDQTLDGKIIVTEEVCQD